LHNLKIKIMAKENEMTQERAVLLTLLEKNSITSKEAFVDWGITRLAAIVHKLNKKGHNIISEDCVTVNRFGHTVTFSKYSKA